MNTFLDIYDVLSTGQVEILQENEQGVLEGKPLVQLKVDRRYLVSKPPAGEIKMVSSSSPNLKKLNDSVNRIEFQICH